MVSKELNTNEDLEESAGFFILRLYVAGQTPKSIEAFENLKRISEQHLKGRYRIEVIDLVKNPKMAKDDQILAIPTLVRRLPEPLKKIIGDCSSYAKGWKTKHTCA